MVDLYSTNLALKDAGSRASNILLAPGYIPHSLRQPALWAKRARAFSNAMADPIGPGHIDLPPEGSFLLSANQ